MQPRHPVLPLVAVGITLLFWSSAFVAIRHLGDVFSPGALSLGRLVVGSLSLGLVLATRGWTPLRGKHWLPLLTIGVLWFCVYNVALNEGERRVDAGTAAMLIQLSPVLIALLAVLFLGERSAATLWLGLAIAFGGVALISLGTSSSGNHDVLGVLLVLVSAASYSVSVILQKPLLRDLSALQVTWIACTVGAVLCLPFAGDLVRETSSASALDIGWVVYLGVFPTAIAFTTYAYALTHMSASSLGVTTYLVPPITVVMAWLLLAETPPLMAYVGGALCLVGVSLARRKPRRSAPLPVEPVVDRA